MSAQKSDTMEVVGLLVAQAIILAAAVICFVRGVQVMRPTYTERGFPTPHVRFEAHAHG